MTGTLACVLFLSALISLSLPSVFSSPSYGPGDKKETSKNDRILMLFFNFIRKARNFLEHQQFNCVYITVQRHLCVRVEETTRESSNILPYR